MAGRHSILLNIDLIVPYTPLSGGHWEGKIVTTIFFLLFWDIIYARLRDLRGLYLSRYQAFPLDLRTDGFYDNRRLLLEHRLRDIEEGSDADMLARMQHTWLSRPESECCCRGLPA